MTCIARAKTTMLVLGAAMLLQAMPLQAEAPEPHCEHPFHIDQLVIGDRGEIGIGKGQMMNGHTIMIFVNPDTRTWSIVDVHPWPKDHVGSLDPRRVACVVLKGDDFIYPPESPGGYSHERGGF